MANNCLVKKLKESVNNDALPELGYITVKIYDGDPKAFYWGTAAGTMKVTGNLYFTNADGDNLGTTMEISTQLKQYRISSGTGYLFLPNKYLLAGYLDLSGLGARAELDISDFAFGTGFYNDNITLSNTKVFGNVSGIIFNHSMLNTTNASNLVGSLHEWIMDCHAKNLLISSLFIRGTKIVFDFADCEYMPGLTRLEPSGNAYGDFSKVGFTQVNNLYQGPISSANTTGSIEDFVANRISTGQTSGAFGLNWPNQYTQVTYTGQTVAQLVNAGTIPGGESTKVHWDAQGNITWTAS